MNSSSRDHAQAATGVREPATYELELCRWEGRIHCAYLNDFRIAGGKPWGGGDIVRRWTLSLSDIEGAIPAFREVREALQALVDQDNRCDGPNIVIPCADHADALRRLNAGRRAVERLLWAATASPSSPNVTDPGMTSENGLNQ